MRAASPHRAMQWHLSRCDTKLVHVASQNTATLLIALHTFTPVLFCPRHFVLLPRDSWDEKSADGDARWIPRTHFAVRCFEGKKKRARRMENCSEKKKHIVFPRDGGGREAFGRGFSIISRGRFFPGRAGKVGTKLPNYPEVRAELPTGIDIRNERNNRPDVLSVEIKGPTEQQSFRLLDINLEGAGGM